MEEEYRIDENLRIDIRKIKEAYITDLQGLLYFYFGIQSKEVAIGEGLEIPQLFNRLEAEIVKLIANQKS